MFCPMCGAPNEDDAVFCGNCGAALKPDVPPPTGATPEPEPDPGPDEVPVEPAPPVEEPAPVPSSGPELPPPPPSYGYAARAPKDRSTALILEILPGLFGLLGFGWLYAGHTNRGLAWLIGVLVWDVVAVVLALVTVGFGLLCTVPVNLALIAISASRLNLYTKQHPELFGP